MRIDFNVLWVDDQPDRIKAQIEAIERRMEAQGSCSKQRFVGLSMKSSSQ
jgi:hypothetical protein